MTAADEGRLAQEVEALGFKALWIPESLGSKEIFAHAGILLAATKTLVIASGIANIWARDPVAMANGARALQEAYADRFLCGVGVLLWLHGPDWGSFKDAFGSVRWEWVAVAVGLNLLSIVARAATRWACWCS